jgi:uncharacterized membrane protein YccC
MDADPGPDADADADPRELAGAYLRPRVRIVATGFLAGAVVGVGLAAVLTFVFGPASPSPVRGARLAFVLGALAFGGGLLGWSGSAMAGDGFEAMQDHLDVGTDWTEADSRRAMARIGAFGAGTMTATGVAEVVALGA